MAMQGSWEKSTQKGVAVYKVNDKVALTVKGLATNFQIKSAGNIEGIEVIDTLNSDGTTTGTLKFEANAPLSSSVTLTPSKGYTYTADVSGSAITKSGFENITKTISNGTLTIKGNITEGYIFSADGKTITYTGAKTAQTLAEVKGFNANLKIQDDKIGTLDGEDFTECGTINDTTGKITLTDVGAFKGESTAVTLTTKNNASYALALGGEIDKYEVTETSASAKDGKLTISNEMSGGWELSSDGKKLTHKDEGPVTLATVSGLSKSLGGKIGTGETSDGVLNFVDVIQVDTVNGTITLTKDALQGAVEGTKGSGATLKNGTGSYKLLLGEYDSETEKFTTASSGTVGFDTNRYYWVVASKGTKATFKADVSEGWTLKNDTTVTYTATTTPTLATISGLKSNSNTDNAKNTTYEYNPEEGKYTYDEHILEGIEVSTPGTDSTVGTITLDNRVLGTTKVSVGAKENYTLALASDGDYKVDKDSATKNDGVWVVNKTTATLYRSNEVYYTTDAANKNVIYNATATAKDKSDVLATLTGLKSGLQVGKGDNYNKLYSYADGEEIVVAELKDDVVTLYDGAQAASNIVIKKGAAAAASYALEAYKGDDKDGYGGVINAPLPDENYVTKVTAGKTSSAITITGTIASGGFTASADNTTLTYTKPVTKPGTLVTISGLSKNLTDGSDGDVDVKEVTNTGDGDEAESSDEAHAVTITLNQTTGRNTVTLTKDALTNANVSVNNTNYTLEIATEGDGKVPTATEEKTVWRVSNGTATYKKVKLAYYTQKDERNLTYVKETDVETYAVVTGLATKSGDNAITYITDDEGGIKYQIGENEAVDLLSVNAKKKTITFNNTDTFATSAKSPVKLDTKKSAGYSLAVAEYAKPEATGKGNTWSISGTTAIYKGEMDAGWKVTDNAITYVPKGTSTLATITGLKNKLSTKAFEGVEPDGNGVITLTNDLLNKTTVEINSVAGYTLGIDTDNDDETKRVDESDTKSTGWVLDASGSATNLAMLKEGTSVGYRVAEDGKSITYSKADYPTSGKTITLVDGLSKDIVLDNESNQIEGIEVNTERKTITLDPSVLGKSNITASNGYTLEIADGDIKSEPGKVWIINGTSAALQDHTTASYTGSGSNTITYKAASAYSADNILTITGLKSGLTTNGDGEIGVLKNGEFTKAVEVDENEITLYSNALDAKSDVVINNTDYKLALATDSLTANSVTAYAETANWIYSAGTTSSGGIATYTVQPTKAGYYLSEDAQTVTYKTKGSKNTTTIKGLGQNLTWDDGYVTVNADAGTITLNEDATNRRNVELTSSLFVFDKGGLSSPKISSGGTSIAYTAKSGVASLTASVESAGWGISEDEKTLIYTPEGEGAVKVTISGLASLPSTPNFEVATDDSEASGGIRMSPSDGTITLYDDVLGTKAVTLDKAATKNYKLALGSNVLGLDEDGTAPDPVTVWRIDKTTATYKMVNPAYYTYDAKANKIVYHKETTVKGKTFATITGLDQTKLAAAYTGTAKTGEIEGLTQTGDTNGGTITLSKNLLGNADVKITGTGFSFLLDNDVPTATNRTNEWQNITEWVTSGTTATYKTYNAAHYDLTNNNTIIKCTKATSGNALAAVTGIAAGVDLDSVYDSTNHRLTLTNNELNFADPKKSKTVKVTKGVGYTVTIAGGVSTPETSHLEWSLKSDKASVAKSAYLVGDRSAGWSPTNDTLLTYTPAKDNESIVVLNGISLSGGGASMEISGGDFGLIVDEDGAPSLDANGNSIITIGSDALGTTKAYVAKSAPYLLQLNGDLEPTTEEAAVAVNGSKGTVVYQERTSDGWTVDDAQKNITYSKATVKTIASVSGLKKNTTGKSATVVGAASLQAGGASSVDLLTLVSDGNGGAAESIIPDVIKISESSIKSDGSLVKGAISLMSSAAFASPTGKVTLAKNSLYDLVLADSLKPQSFGDSPKWYASGANASLKQGTSSGYSISADGNTASYVKESPGAVIVSISGLNKNVKAGTGDNEGDLGIYTKSGKVSTFTKGVNILPGNVIQLTSAVVGTTNISLNNNSTVNYTFAAEGIDSAESGRAMIFAKSGTATVKQSTTAGFTLNEDRNVFTYTPGKNAATLLTLSGLNKSVSIGSGSVGGGVMDAGNGIMVDITNHQVTLSSSALTTSNVTAKSGEKGVAYEIIRDSDVATAAVNATEWVTSGDKATYKNYDRGYYTYGTIKGGGTDTSKLTYNKATTGTGFATISGIKSGVSIASSNFDNSTKTVKLTEEMLTTKNLTIKGDAYTFDVGGISSSLSVSDDARWSEASSKGVSILKGTRSAGYWVSGDSKTLTYLKKDDTKELSLGATISGLKASVTVDFDNDQENVIVLSEGDLNNKTVTLSGSNGYKLGIDEGITAAGIESAQFTSVKSGAVTLSGVVSEAGYQLSHDGKALTYTKKATDKADNTVAQNLATIKGVTGTQIIGDTIDSANKKISLTGEGLSDKVTVTAGIFAVSVGSSFNSKALSGSSASDTVSIGGTGVSLNTGKGNDYVDFNGNSNNVFFYASGDGVDTIANFAKDDVINVTNYNITKENIKIGDINGDGDEDDVIIAIGSGSIILEDYLINDDKTITITDKTKTSSTYSWDDELSCYVKNTATGSGYVLESAVQSVTPTLAKTDAISYTPSKS